MENDERASREELSIRTESIFYEVESMINKEKTPEVEKQGLEVDELSVVPRKRMLGWN